MEAASKEVATNARARRAARAYMILAALAAVVAGIWFVHRWMTKGKQSTDDAQIEADVIPISSRVGGVILNAKVHDNQLVHAGDVLFEIDPALCALAQDNIVRNGFADRARAVAHDVASLAQGRFDHVLMNPPFNDPSHQPSPDPDRRRAHAGPSDLLARWAGSARAVLRDHGTVTLIWRAEGLAEVISALADGFGAVSILPVYPAPGRPAIRLIAHGIGVSVYEQAPTLGEVGAGVYLTPNSVRHLERVGLGPAVEKYGARIYQLVSAN